MGRVYSHKAASVPHSTGWSSIYQGNFSLIMLSMYHHHMANTAGDIGE